MVGIVFALFTVGYVFGVWTACLVFHQSQQAYEDGTPARMPSPAFAQFADSGRSEPGL